MKETVPDRDFRKEWDEPISMKVSWIEDILDALDRVRKERDELKKKLEWVRDEWNKVINPKNTRPKKPAFIDLIAYTKDVKEASDKRDQLINNIMEEFKSREKANRQGGLK